MLNKNFILGVIVLAAAIFFIVKVVAMMASRGLLG